MAVIFIPAHEARAAGICSWCKQQYHAPKQDGGIVVPTCARCRQKLRGTKETDGE